MNLARIRELRGLTQRELGEMVGLSAATIQRAEVGAATAKLETYKKCAEALKVSLSDIFSEDMTPVERELIQIFRQIPASKHAQLLGLLELAQEGDLARD
ncbi:MULTISPECIES: helix-turn-helix transcriptional regulator [unclassified Yoonia]|uniref:helix-turn-helix domain-containing protein n=1 Tax=unclassified Yoonia TaxID=2629118 RepID=UPI002AFF2CB5|nr:MULTISPECIES: helix-turn-helix transcriptional regulator [unclassified Yoonia]